MFYWFFLQILFYKKYERAFTEKFCPKTFSEKQTISIEAQCCFFTKSSPMIFTVNQWTGVMKTLSWILLKQT